MVDLEMPIWCLRKITANNTSVAAAQAAYEAYVAAEAANSIAAQALHDANEGRTVADATATAAVVAAITDDKAEAATTYASAGVCMMMIPIRHPSR